MKIFKQDKWFGLMDGNGTIVLPAKFYESFVKSVKKLPFQELIKIKLVDIKYDLEPNGMYIFKNKNNSKEGLKDYNGKIVVECNYDFIYGFYHNKLSEVEKNNKFGAINEKGELVIDCKYDFIWAFQFNGLAKVRLKNEYGIINTQGKEIAECKYSLIDRFQLNGLAQAMLGNEVGVLNTRGEWSKISFSPEDNKKL